MKQHCDRSCPGRSPTCHAECEKYRAYAEQQRKEYTRRKMLSDVISASVEGSIRRGSYTPNI